MSSVVLQRAPFPEREALAAQNPAVSITSRIASHAAAAPQQLAVVDGVGHLTYAELECRANQLAAFLLEEGAGPESCIGLLLERSAEFVVAALAILKTGAAYLPLDASTPADRASFILADSGAILLVTHRQKARGLKPAGWRAIEIDGSDAPSIATQPTNPICVEPIPSSLAYVVYTSGSTGRPKGVEITHANLCNLIEWHQSAFNVTAADRASQVAGLGFDAAGWEIWPYLTAGASLHFADELTRRSAQALRDWIVAERITLSFVPTVLAEQLLGESWPADSAFRILLTGADTLHRRPIAGLPFVLVNNYGPSECTVVATSGTVAPDADASGPPSIGRPITNAVVLILDEELRPVSPGGAGELCIGGMLVGRGYRNNPELTASRFVTYSPRSGPPLRVYRTGDRARLLASGEIAFLGRLDEQVKIRGYRVELGEIVACLDRYPGIEASAAVVCDTADGPILVAYVVAARNVRLTASDLREFLATRLPDYMIPARYVTISTLPMTANGKLDKSALPAPTADNVLRNRDTAAAPSPDDGLQAKIAAMVASLLGQPAVAIDDNFFMLGGHSMLGVQLVARLRDMFGVKLTLRQLFDAPTVAGLSAAVARLVEASR
ncbi:MAG TPA: amino acid adenylation domain-containing protein [Tepidisphaeraceae bacterium]|jgi:amino acid adenylation domain-containing protein|nr:amino acid adenylation domain-containing protein [Tepidisphaeraceae bacterium]